VRTDRCTLAVVIVNYRTAGLTEQCLRSLAEEVVDVSGARVVVVDNGSGDGSAERFERVIRERGWSEWASVLALPENVGFAAGNNRGIEAVGEAEHYLLLNSDTIAHRGALSHCLTVMEREPDVGAMSCLVANEDGSPQTAARRFPTPIRQLLSAVGLPWRAARLFRWADVEDPGWDRRTVRRDVDWLGGAFLLVRGEALRQVGPLDERFFMYGEDVELCHRLARAGWRRLYDPSVAITHFGAGSSEATASAIAAKNERARRARRLVQRLCYGRGAAWALRAMDFTVGAIRSASRGLARRERRSEAQGAAERTGEAA